MAVTVDVNIMEKKVEKHNNKLREIIRTTQKWSTNNTYRKDEFMKRAKNRPHKASPRL